MSHSLFLRCPFCGQEWDRREQFIADPDLQLIGYQANFIHLEKGLFLFNHSCQTTVAVPVQAFADLYQGPVFAERLQGSETCSGYCLHRHALETCPKQCECAYVREILQLLGGPELG